MQYVLDLGAIYSLIAVLEESKRSIEEGDRDALGSFLERAASGRKKLDARGERKE